MATQSFAAYSPAQEVCPRLIRSIQLRIMKRRAFLSWNRTQYFLIQLYILSILQM